MRSIDFIRYEIKGDFIDVVTKAQFLRNHGINVNVSNGSVSVNSANEYMKALLLLRKYNYLDKKEQKIWIQELYDKLKYRRTVNKKYNFINQGNNRVIMYHNSGDFLSIIKQKNKKSGKFEYIIMAKNSDPEFKIMENKVSKRMSSYYISSDNPLFEMATKYCKKRKILDTVDVSPVHFTPAPGGYFLNFVNTKPVCYAGTCILKFSENSHMIESMFKMLKAQDSRKTVDSKSKVYQISKSIAY